MSAIEPLFRLSRTSRSSSARAITSTMALPRPTTSKRISAIASSLNFVARSFALSGELVKATSDLPPGKDSENLLGLHVRKQLHFLCENIRCFRDDRAEPRRVQYGLWVGNGGQALELLSLVPYDVKECDNPLNKIPCRLSAMSVLQRGQISRRDPISWAIAFKATPRAARISRIFFPKGVMGRMRTFRISSAQPDIDRPVTPVTTRCFSEAKHDMSQIRRSQPLRNDTPQDAALLRIISGSSHALTGNDDHQAQPASVRAVQKPAQVLMSLSLSHPVKVQFRFGLRSSPRELAERG